MSRYGINFYGPGTYYGEAPLIEFDARPMSAVSREYGQLTITWQSPAGAWDRLRLTRDPFGFSPRADMGTVLIDRDKASGVPVTYTDPERDDLPRLSEGRFYYYTVWVRATLDGVWRRAGDVIGLVTQNWGYSGRMFQLVPGIYRDRDMMTYGYGIYGRGDLERFLDIPGFEADHIRTECESLKWVNDPSRVSGGLLPLMAAQLGFGYEGELGMRLARQQMSNAVYVYKHKGTRLGIEAVTSVLTGWAPTVTIGKNLVLDQNNSSFEEGTGRWTNVSNTTLGRRSVTDATAPGAIAGPVAPPPGASTGDVGSGSWWGMLTAIGAGDMVIQSFANGTIFDNRTNGIPVVAGQQYTISIYSRALDTAASVTLGAEWFTGAPPNEGTSLGAVTWGSATANLTTAATRHTYTVTAPANAMYLRVSLRVNSAGAGNRHLIDALQVEAGTTATAYQSARSIRVSFLADRVNLVPNSGAEASAVGTTGWGTNNVTLARDATTFRSGGASFKLTATAGADMQIFTTNGPGLPVVGGRYYTASFYLYKATGTARQFRVEIQWNTAASAPITVVTGTNVLQTLGSWTRCSITALAPPTAAYALMTLRVVSAGAGENQWIDDILFEQGTALLNYFDGSTASNEGEYMWQSGGTPGSTPSHYYARRLIKNYRLNQRLKEFLPAGSTYALLYAGAT